MKLSSLDRRLGFVLSIITIWSSIVGVKAAAAGSWNRVSTFLACYQEDAVCDTNVETVAEIVTVTESHMAVYADSKGQRLGLVDVSDPTNPMAAGTIDLGGEPTSVAVKGNYAIVAINLSDGNFTHPSGVVRVLDLTTSSVVAEMDTGGQPDSVAISPDGSFAAIVVENERDEDLNDGLLPQLPAGLVWIMDTSSETVDSWTMTRVELTNLTEDMLYPTDPEPEFVAINANNVAVVTLQENNWIVLIDCATAQVTNSFTAGSGLLSNIDTEDNGVIDFGTAAVAKEGATPYLREPDAVTWIGTDYFATADEGDLDGGSRSFTIFNLEGTAVYESGNMLEHMAARYGHYPEGRSDNKGTEPEGILYFETNDSQGWLVVLLERAGSAVIFAVDVTMNEDPKFMGFLPTLLRPEGVAKIPGKDAFVIACEEDSRADKFRAGLVTFSFDANMTVASYPSLVSADRDETSGIPLAFSALSGLAASDPVGFPEDYEGEVTSGILYSVEDSAYTSSRFFTINTTSFPYVVSSATRIMDTNDVLKTAFSTDDFNGYVLVNSDNTVNLDPEGIAVSYKGGFWIANEGRGTVGDAERPIEMLNFIMKVDMDGAVESLIQLPDEVNDIQLRFGLEGVAEQGDYLVVTFQRAWGDEENPRIGIYNTMDETWKFVFYPLDDRTSPAGGWVGLSDISPLGGGRFLVTERDNQAGPDARIKRLYEISLGECFAVEEESTLTKTLKRDMLADGDLPALNGFVYEKMEGLAVTSSGRVWCNNDNDGVDDNSGEQYLFDLGDGVVNITKEEAEADCEDSASSKFPASLWATAAALLVAVLY